MTDMNTEAMRAAFRDAYPQIDGLTVPQQDALYTAFWQGWKRGQAALATRPAVPSDAEIDSASRQHEYAGECHAFRMGAEFVIDWQAAQPQQQPSPQPDPAPLVEALRIAQPYIDKWQKLRDEAGWTTNDAMEAAAIVKRALAAYEAQQKAGA